MSEEGKIDRNTPVPPAPQGDDAYNEQFAERFMIGNLIKAATRQLKELLDDEAP